MNENITPLPWAYDQGVIYADHGIQVHVARTEGLTDRESVNGAYLAEAANAYPALTARVKELEEALGDCVGMLRGFTSSEHDEEGAVTQQIKDADAALNKEPTT